jgi:hypothetical protein
MTDMYNRCIKKKILLFWRLLNHTRTSRVPSRPTATYYEANKEG